MQIDTYSLNDEEFNSIYTHEDDTIYEEPLNDWMNEILAPVSNPLMTDVVSHGSILNQTSVNNFMKSKTSNLNQTFQDENPFEVGDIFLETSPIQSHAFNNEVTIELDQMETTLSKRDLLCNQKDDYILSRISSSHITSPLQGRSIEKIKYFLHPTYEQSAIDLSQKESRGTESCSESNRFDNSDAQLIEGLPLVNVDSSAPQIYQFPSENGIDGSIDSFPLTPPGSNNSSDNDLHTNSNSLSYSMEYAPLTTQIRRPRPRSYVNPIMKLDYNDRYLFGNSFLHRDSDSARHSGRFADYFQQTDIQQGTLVLTEDEKRALLSEGYPIPSRLPLTKTEERNLKKIRRKIKNKISAQESRRKKKEYMELLEKKVEVYSQENHELRYRLDQLESSNRSLLSQLRHLQQTVNRSGLSAVLPNQGFHSTMDSQEPLLGITTSRSHLSQRHNSSASPSNSTASTPFMAMFLCFALIFSGVAPPFGPTNINKSPSPLLKSTGSTVSSLYSLSFIHHREDTRLIPDNSINSNTNITRPFLPELDSGRVEDNGSSSKQWCSRINCVTLPRIEDQLGKSRLLDTTDNLSTSGSGEFVPGPHNIWWLITGRNPYYVTSDVVDEDEDLPLEADVAPPLPSDYLKRLLVLTHESSVRNCSDSCHVTISSNVTQLL